MAHKPFDAPGWGVSTARVCSNTPTAGGVGGTAVGVGGTAVGVGIGWLIVSMGISPVLFPAGVQLININISNRITEYLKKII